MAPHDALWRFLFLDPDHPGGDHPDHLDIEKSKIRDGRQFSSPGKPAGYSQETIRSGRTDQRRVRTDEAGYLRILNGSNSRIFRLAWSNGKNLQILGTDGGLLEKPLNVPDIMLGPAERVDLWADFGGMPEGSIVSLQSLPFNPGGGRMGMMGRGARLPNGSRFQLVRFHVSEAGKGETTPPERLTSLERLDPSQAENREHPKQFFLDMRHMQPTINGRTFDMSEVAPDEMVRLRKPKSGSSSIPDP